MTDFELLELAAKAVGLKYGGDEFYDKYGPCVVGTHSPTTVLPFGWR